MLKVLLPPHTVKFCCQSRGIMVGGLWPTSLLRLGSFRCHWWGNTLHRCGGQITLLMWWLHTSLLLHPLGPLMDQSLSPCPLVVGLPQSCELGPLVGAVFPAEGSNMTPLPVDLPGSCTTCWYGVAGHPGHG